jgi:type II secretory pathway component PulJ
MGFLVALIAMVIAFALMLPLIGSIYYDTLAVQKESKMQIERMERLRQQLEQDRKDLDRMKNSRIFMY